MISKTMNCLALLAMTLFMTAQATLPLPFGPKFFNFSTNLDHYSSGGNSRKFNIRYILNAEYWDPENGPILFYAGNEGNINKFY